MRPSRLNFIFSQWVSVSPVRCSSHGACAGARPARTLVDAQEECSKAHSCQIAGSGTHLLPGPSGSAARGKKRRSEGTDSRKERGGKGKLGRFGVG